MGQLGRRNPNRIDNHRWQLFYQTISKGKIERSLLASHRRKRTTKRNLAFGLASLEYRILGRGNIIDVGLLVSSIGGNVEEMNQKKALGVSIKAFALLIVVVCFVYEVITPSVGFANLWFSYLVGAVLYAIGVLMTS